MKKNEYSEINFIKDIQLNEKNEYVVDNIEYDKAFCINILARNLKSNELILYNSIKRIMIKPSYILRYLSYIIAIIFLCFIIYISIHYYQKEKFIFSGYKIANNKDNRRDDVKYTNINTLQI